MREKMSSMFGTNFFNAVFNRFFFFLKWKHKAAPYIFFFFVVVSFGKPQQYLQNLLNPQIPSDSHNFLM